jgi:WD40 repeat protein
LVSDVAFSADDRWIATAGATKAGIWESHANDLHGGFLQFARGNTGPLTGVAFSPHGWKLATTSRDGSVRILDCKLCGGLPQLESYAKARLARLPR